MTAKTQTTSPKPATPKIRDAGFFYLRTPLLPFDQLTAWSEGIDAASDVDALRARLRAIVERPDVREAIFIASPTLAGEIPVWLREPTSERGEKVERGLVRYFSRMCGRATPFGLFAGGAVGTVGPSTQLALDAASQYRSHTRLDMNYVCALAAHLLSLPELSEQVTYHTNSSLYRVSDQYRYFEWKPGADGYRSYGLVAVTASEYLDRVIERCTTGARRRDIVELLMARDAELGRDETTAYVADLIASQVLIADFPPRVTGPEPLPEMIARIEGIPELAEVTDVLRYVHDELAAIDASELGDRSDRHQQIVARLSRLPVPVDAARVFQVDMVKQAPRATLGPEVIAEITRAVELLHQLGPTAGDSPLHELAQKFSQRFEAREVPLAEALDEEWGISPPNGDPSPLLKDLQLVSDGHSRGPTMTRLQSFLLGEIQGAVQRGARTIEIDEAKLRPLFTDDPAPLFSAISTMATVVARSADAVARGEFHVVVEGASGPSGAALLGRFCHADPALERHVQDYVRAERELRPDVIYAEVVHQPQSRIGNIIARPVLTDYEIVYLGQSGVPLDWQIPISDLLLSVVDGRFVLRSRRLDREVVPRMSNAHNRFGGLMAYQFLGHFASKPGLGLHIGPLDNLPFVPRIVVGRTVLHLATWRLSRDELVALDKPSAAERFAAAQALRARRALPRLIAVQDYDNELPIDLDNALSVDSFVHLVKQRPVVQLVEVHGPDGLCAEGPEGRFVHELVVPLLNGAAPTRTRALPPRREFRAKRRFVPGSEWLFIKLYLGATAADRVLRMVVDPIVQQATASGACDRWFFLRYNDPDFHLRVRFHGEPDAVADLTSLIHGYAEPMVADGLIHRLQLDTYEREIERYGGDDGIVLAEQLFHADSEAVLDIVRTLDTASELDARWRFTLLGIDLLLQDLGFDLAQRHEVIRDQRAGFGKEFGVNTLFERGLGNKFRKQRIQLDAMLNGDTTGNLAAVRDAFDRRSERLRPVVDQLTALAGQGRLSLPITELAKSYVHMHANRFLRSAPREHELVLYDFLERCYTSFSARSKHSTSAIAAG